MHISTIQILFLLYGLSYANNISTYPNDTSFSTTIRPDEAARSNIGTSMILESVQDATSASAQPEATVLIQIGDLSGSGIINLSSRLATSPTATITDDSSTTLPRITSLVSPVDVTSQAKNSSVSMSLPTIDIPPTIFPIPNATINNTSFGFFPTSPTEFIGSAVSQQSLGAYSVAVRLVPFLVAAMYLL